MLYLIIVLLTAGSTVKSLFDVSSLFAQAMLQGSTLVLKCKLSYSQSLATVFAPPAGVEHWEHPGSPSHRGDEPGLCLGDGER